MDISYESSAWPRHLQHLFWWRTLRKHACSNILKISRPKTESFHIQILIFFFYISAQNIDCEYSLGSNEYPQSMF